MRSRLPLEPAERVLAWAALDEGDVVVATDRALLHPHGGAFERVPWWQVTAVTWTADERLLVVDTGTGSEARSIRLAVAVDSLLPETVRERVQSSIILSQRVTLAPGVGARVVARRVAGRDEPLWQLVLDHGLDPDDPRIRVLAERTLAEIRRQTIA